MHPAEQILRYSSHALDSEYRVCRAVTLFAMSWARKDEALALIVSHVEYKLQGIMLMFKSHEAYQFYFNGFLEKQL